jgi:hypothetical protein
MQDGLMALVGKMTPTMSPRPSDEPVMKTRAMRYS